MLLGTIIQVQFFTGSFILFNVLLQVLKFRDKNISLISLRNTIIPTVLRIHGRVHVHVSPSILLPISRHLVPKVQS